MLKRLIVSTRINSKFKTIRNVQTYTHVPIMAERVLDFLKPEDGKVYIDMTFGTGGHSRELLATNKSITIIAVDRDPNAYAVAQELSRQISIKSQNSNLNQRVIPIHGKFSSIMDKIHLSGIHYDSVDGVLFDLGASSIQLDDPERGFVLSTEGKLDMRMDTSDEHSLTAEDVVNNLDVPSLSKIFKIYGEERRSLKVANAIMDARELIGRIKTTQELARIIYTSRSPSLDSIDRYSHPGAKIFQALRIFVNNELNEFNYGLEKIRYFLKPSINSDSSNAGVAVVLSFSSQEDKIAKKHFTSIDPKEPDFKKFSQHDRIQTEIPNDTSVPDEEESSKDWKPINKSVIKATREEITANPKLSSAKLRAAARLR